MKKDTVSRRQALHIIGASTGSLVLIGCNAEKKAAAPMEKKAAAPAAASKPAAMAAAKGDDDCNAAIDATSKQLRSTLQYVEKSKIEGKQCGNCLQYVEPAAGKSCGGCKLFTGPVQTNGYCLSWAAKQPS
ncbi:MAG: high-potential iron-sulfur protein [Myxococcota bacterium]